MKKYSVSIPWHMSHFVKVEAKNKKEALEKAISKASPSVCCHCSGSVQIEEMNCDIKPDVQEARDR